MTNIIAASCSLGSKHCTHECKLLGLVQSVQEAIVFMLVASAMAGTHREMALLILYGQRYSLLCHRVKSFPLTSHNGRTTNIL